MSSSSQWTGILTFFILKIPSSVFSLSTSMLPVEEPMNTLIPPNSSPSAEATRSASSPKLSLVAPIWNPQLAYERPSDRLHFSRTLPIFTVGGLVFGMSMKDVTPPSRAASDSLPMSALDVIPGSRKCTCASMPPAIRTLPVRSRISVSGILPRTRSGIAVNSVSIPSNIVIPSSPGFHISRMMPSSIKSVPCLTSSDVAMDAFARRILLRVFISIMMSYFPLGLIFLNLNLMTPQNASPKILPLILEVPALRFTKITGTSVIGNPRRYAVYFISIWKP